MTRRMNAEDKSYRAVIVYQDERGSIVREYLGPYDRLSAARYARTWRKREIERYYSQYQVISATVQEAGNWTDVED